MEEPVVVTMQHDRRALRYIAVLVHVDRHGRHARHAKVPRRDVVTQPVEERQHETTDARVDVATGATSSATAASASTGSITPWG